MIIDFEKYKREHDPGAYAIGKARVAEIREALEDL